MEETKNVNVEAEELDQVSGGSGFSGGYCPFTPDRRCKIEEIGRWSEDSEFCKECGWRAW